MKIKIAAFGLLLAFISSAQAETKDAARYASVEEIPAPLRMSFGGEGYREGYIHQILIQLRRAGTDHKTLTKADIERSREQILRQQRREQVSRILAYDINFDGTVTRDEVIESIERQYSGQLERHGLSSETRLKELADNVMKQDANADDTITYAEMAQVAENERKGSRDATLENLLALDPNADGTLEISELETLALKAFNTIDVDGDGIASGDERKKLQPLRTRDMAMARKPAANCRLPKAGADEKVVFIGAYEGKTVSNITIAGQVADTDIIPLDIAKGTEKLFIVATSFSPAIWQVTGDTGRISRLVVGGRSMPDGTTNNDIGAEKVNAGVTGVPKDKITFFHARSCGLDWDVKGEGGSAALSVKSLVGAAPVSAVSAYGILTAKISGAVASLQEKGEKLPGVPDGFEKSAWQQHVAYMPGGLIRLALKDVVSDAPAALYEVLPQWAGISKLLHDGALEPMGQSKLTIITRADGQRTTVVGISKLIVNDNSATIQTVEQPSGYKIIKDIPFYPSGLYGAYSTQFLVAKGVKQPAGDAGHSDVHCEDSSACTEQGPGIRLKRVKAVIPPGMADPD